MRIQDLSVDERPREKALKMGIDTLSNIELLALILRSGIRDSSVFDIAENILMMSGGIENLLYLKDYELRSIRGISVAKSLELMASFELTKRAAFQKIKQLPQIYHAKDIVDWLRLEMGYLKQEHCLVVFLNTKNRIIRYKTMFQGGLSECTVHPREIFKEAMAYSSASIIVVHNHPSGDPSPSREDILITKQIREAGNLVGIKLLDHIVITNDSYVSMAQGNLL